jgi:hypothetical protein
MEVGRHAFKQLVKGNELGRSILGIFDLIRDVFVRLVEEKQDSIWRGFGYMLSFRTGIGVFRA